MFHTLEDIATHLDSLSNDDWNKLFYLIPIIESTEEFITGGGAEMDDNDPETIRITPVLSANIVHDFEKVMYDLDLVIDFDWGSWDEGREIATNKNFKNQDAITLLKLLTAFIRNNRFCDGALAGRFKDKSIESILKVLRKLFFKNYPQEE
jgi:hypothetical protein